MRNQLSVPGGEDPRLGSPAQLVNRHAEVGLDVLHGLFQGQSVTRHDRGGVDVVLDELVRPLQQLCRHDHHRRRPVAHLDE